VCGALAWVCLLACVQPALNAQGQRDWSHGRTRQVALFASSFAGSSIEGWGLEAEAPGIPPAPHVSQLRTENRALVASDAGPAVWYYTVPEEWGGDQGAMYNGEIFFKLWHPEQPAAGTDAAKSGKNKNTPDVIIETTCGFSVRLHDVFPAPRVSSAVYNVPISEVAASWIDSRTEKRITQLDLLVALSHLRVIKLRGGSLRGAETVRLAEFRIMPPVDGMINRDQLEPCCSPHGRMATCQRKGPKVEGLSHYSESLTFPGLGFECGGSLVPPEVRPRVRYFHPQTSRRTGGARITVYGENFGMNGNSYVRIAGKKASNCDIPKAQHCVNGILDFDEQNIDCGGQNCAPCTYRVPHCFNGILDLDEDKKDCGGRDCELCPLMVLASHCTNGVRDQDEADVDKGGVDCKPLFCFDSRIEGDKRDREGNCGGSCEPCFPRSVAPPDTLEAQVVMCDAPGDLEDEDAQVSFTSVDAITLQETSSCFNDDAAARGFIFDGFDHTWSLHMASLDTLSETDVNVTAIAIDEITGHSYVTASVSRVFSKGDGKMTVMGKHLDKRGFVEPGAPPIGVNSKDDFAVPNDGSGNTISDLLIHTVLLKIGIHGHPEWITYMESQYKMVAEDILVDTSARPTRIVIAGIFSGNYPRLYNVNRLTKRAKRGGARERGGGIICPDMSVVTDMSECWYFEGEPNYRSPTTPGTIEIAKPGIFLASYNVDGLATAFKGGIYFKSIGSSFPAAGTVRIAAHTTARRNSPRNGSKDDEPSAYVDDYNGLYLSAKILVSRYRDTMYFGEQSPGYSRVGMQESCTNRIVNESWVCVSMMHLSFLVGLIYSFSSSSFWHQITNLKTLPSPLHSRYVCQERS